MKRKQCLFTSALLAVILLFTCCAQATSQPIDDRATELTALANAFTLALHTGDTQTAMSMLDESTSAALDGKLDATWLQLTQLCGEFIDTGANQLDDSNGDLAHSMTLNFQNGTLIQRIVFDGENRISGLWFGPGKVEGETMEERVLEDRVEIPVTVDSGEGYPLDGILTMPRNESPKAAIVLVHGSGASNMNEAVGANAPFQDLAHGLAKEGIATLRYDKRTYTHGAKMAESADIAKLTIDEETAFDALAAVKLLQATEGIDPAQVYLLGHSMGGGLLSYINSLGADCAGYIIMAGTPRNLWELSADQNLLVADEVEAGGDADTAAQIRDFVETEAQKGRALVTMSDEDALEQNSAIFGISAWYLRKFDQIDAAALHLADAKPVLVLQGEADRQVTMMDFELWIEAFATHPDATFASFPGLNHPFGAYEGDAVPFTQMVAVEYAQRTPVPEDVIQTIAGWISLHVE